ncbi:MAG: DUF1343 domain-containing protein [Bacteroidales bacterium]|nr:DUF1343 domain-containing protein [Bacteroidales bacterium]
MPLLRGKRVALTANPTAQAFGKHLLDVLIEGDVDVTKVFAPEHGFRGAAEAGEKVASEVDAKTGVKIVSLFGKNLKPTPEQMSGLDFVVYDIQDVGCRFFTYISTLHNVMEAAAAANVKVLVLDRPNPNIDYVAGPIRDADCASFVSMDPIPIVYGMTVGELAKMINGEGWLKGGVKCDLTVVPVANYNRSMRYELPIKPSPNLPDYLSVRMYPSLCLFEATNISVGRGTETPFTYIGYPDPKYGEYVFTPHDIPGMQTNPMHEGKKCYGVDFHGVNPDSARFTLKYFIDMYRISGGTSITSRNMLGRLYGSKSLEKMLAEGKTEQEIMQTWEPGLSNFKAKREQYLIYQ